MNYDAKKKEIDLMNYLRVILKRKWVIITFASSLILFTGIFSFLARPKYKATATLLIEEGTSKILNIDETFGFGYQSSVVRDLRFFNTELELLKSRSLAERVAKKMKLLSQPDSEEYGETKKGVLSKLGYLFTFQWVKSKRESEEKRSGGLVPNGQYAAATKMLQDNLKSSPIRDTKLVKISFTSPSPSLACDIINNIAEEFANFSVEKRYERTRQASDFLSTQIATLQDEITAKERELQRYVKEEDLFSLSNTESATLNTLDDYYKAYTQARIERIKAEAAYRELKDLDIDSIPLSVSNPAIQELKAAYTKIKNEYEEKSSKFKPSYPEMIQLKAKMDSTREQLQKEVETAKSEYNTALNREYYLKGLLDKQKEEVVRINSSAILYNSLKIEIENKRRQINSLIEKRDETLVSEELGGIKASNVTIIDRAEIPKKPSSPKKGLNLILAFLFGIFGGISLSFVFEYLDDTIKGPEDVEKLAGLPSLGVIPYLPPEGLQKRKGYGSYLGHRYSYGKENSEREHTLPEIKEIELVNYLHPDGPLSEDYRTVRTSILLSHAEKPPKIIVFTSALTQEGKTATVVNMGISFAQLQERVLILETDLRKPRLHRLFKLRNVNGLTGYLTGKVPLKEIIQKTFIENIWLVPSGPIPPNPAELLNSKKMKDILEEVSQVFDVVLLDSPPVLAVVDPVIISSIADSMVIVIRGGKTRRKPLLSAVEELRRARANIIGVVFNAADLSKEGSYYSTYYRYYKYGLYGKEDQKALPDSR